MNRYRGLLTAEQELAMRQAAYSLRLDHADAEDVQQEAAVILWQRGDGSCHAAYAVARGCAIDAIRRHTGRGKLRRQFVPEDQAPEPAVEDAESAAAVRRVIARLKPQQAALAEALMSSDTHDDAARALGCRRETVTLNAGRLRAELERHLC